MQAGVSLIYNLSVIFGGSSENQNMKSSHVLIRRMTEICELSRSRILTEQEKKLINKKIDDDYKQNGTYLIREHQEVLDDVIFTNKIKLSQDKKKFIERELAYNLIYIPEFKVMVDRKDPDFSACDLVFHTDDITENTEIINDSFDVFKAACNRAYSFVQAKIRETCIKSKNKVEEDYNRNGIYISDEHKRMLDSVLSADKIKLNEKQRKRIEKQLAINFLINPYYKIIFETCDSTITKDNNTPNKSVIKNINDVFRSIWCVRIPKDFASQYEKKYNEMQAKKAIQEVVKDPHCPFLLVMPHKDNALFSVRDSIEQKNEKRVIEKEKQARERLENEQKRLEQENERIENEVRRANYIDALCKKSAVSNELQQKANDRFYIVLRHMNPEPEAIHNEMIEREAKKTVIIAETSKEVIKKDRLEDQTSTVLCAAQNGEQQTISDKYTRYIHDCIMLSVFNDLIPKHDRSKTLRVMSYNVNKWLTGWGESNIDLVFDSIKKVNPDIVCLQEMYFDYKDQDSWLLKKFNNMGYGYGGVDTFGFQSNHGKDTCGTIIFSKYPITRPLMRVFEKPGRGDDNDRRNTRYSFAGANIIYNKKPLCIINTKLDSVYHVNRVSEVKEITGFIDEKKIENVFVCGDFGEPYKQPKYSTTEWDVIQKESERLGTKMTTYVEDGFNKAGFKNGLEQSDTKLVFTHWSGTVNDLGLTKEPKKGDITIDKIYHYFSPASGHIPVIFDLSIKN